jgi:hypothetical protein
MKPKFRYLAASMISFFKPFLIGAIAVGIGLNDSGAFAASYLRYLIFPHLVPAICFLLLFFDEEGNKPLKALAALVEAGSILALLLSLRPVLDNPQALFLVAGTASRLSKTALAFAAVLFIDLTCVITLLTWGKTTPVTAIDPIPTEKEL